MKLYIVTPAYNARSWLPGCVRSVVDQTAEGIHVHHHIQDGQSTDGSTAWLQNWAEQHRNIPGYTFSYESSADTGMYDAINKAWRRMPEDADITAHLNSDEQYLPQALHSVARVFETHPETDMLLTSHIVTDLHGNYICHRRPVAPTRWISNIITEIITCACFHRASSFRKHNVRFDTQWKSLGDIFFYRDILRTAPRILLQPSLFTTTFCITGQNLGWSETTQKEGLLFDSKQSALALTLRKPAILLCGLKRYTCDLFLPPPADYATYRRNDETRTIKIIKRPTPRWGCRTTGQE
ncbi:MAG: glycosyltransferase [Akkermansia sp.]|nr:glycosyltransferase [Akkermansia sp.]